MFVAPCVDSGVKQMFVFPDDVSEEPVDLGRLPGRQAGQCVHENVLPLLSQAYISQE